MKPRSLKTAWIIDVFSIVKGRELPNKIMNGTIWEQEGEREGSGELFSTESLAVSFHSTFQQCPTVQGSKR